MARVRIFGVSTPDYRPGRGRGRPRIGADEHGSGVSAGKAKAMMVGPGSGGSSARKALSISAAAISASLARVKQSSQMARPAARSSGSLRMGGPKVRQRMGRWA